MASITSLRGHAAATPAVGRARAGGRRHAPLVSGDALVLEGVTRSFGALRAIDDVTFCCGRRRAPRDARRQRRRQDDAVQRDHRRLSADRRTRRLLRRGHHRLAAVRAHPARPAPHVPVVAAVSRPDGARQPLSRGARRSARPLQLASRPAPMHTSTAATRDLLDRVRLDAHRRRAGRRLCRTASSASSRSAWRSPARRA